MELKSAVRLPGVCDACMEREVQHKVNGEMQTDIQYYHRIVAVVLVSTDFPIPLGVRFQKNGEAEVSCALALLQDLVGQLGRRFLDVLVGGRFVSASPLRPRSGTSGSGLGLHLEREPARVIARGGASHPGISRRRSRGARPGDSLLALAGRRLAGRRSPGADRQNGCASNTSPASRSAK